MASHTIKDFPVFYTVTNWGKSIKGDLTNARDSWVLSDKCKTYLKANRK